jgi:hypothetical protein
MDKKKIRSRLDLESNFINRSIGKNLLTKAQDKVVGKGKQSQFRE